MKKITLLILTIPVLKAIAADTQPERTAKTNQKIANEIKLIVKFAQDSREAYKDLRKRSGLTKSDLEHINKAEKLNLKLLEDAKSSIKKLEAN